jgi:ubiquinone/menaquinone biosynthesis C-methylase UbiE
MTFEDHFSSLASLYAAHRPRYPRALFEHHIELVEARDLCWDCATGQGQAALALSEWFDRVIATDASEEQLKQAPAHPKVEFRKALAERSGLADRSVDLITVATAIHWFDFDAFHAEVRRVAKPGAVLAASELDLVQFLGWVRSWSAVPRFVEVHGDPLPPLEQALAPLWTERRRVRWPLHFALGRVSG